MHYKVVVVDDSPFMRKIISDLIEKDPAFKVVGTAVNGWEALIKISELKPDIVTMDVEMPEMNGLEALKTIMRDNPLPVIMLSGINEEGMRETILALESGAFDFIRKPSVSVSNDINQVSELLLEKMKVAMQAKERRAAWQAEELVRSDEIKKYTRKEIEKDMSDHDPAKPVDDRSKLSIRKSIIESIYDVKENVKRTIVSPKQEKPLKDHKASSVSIPRSPSSGKRITTEKHNESTKELVVPKLRNGLSKISQPLEGISTSFQHLVAIGCSTGGPRALKELLERIPEGFPAPVVIVQHMPPKFTKSLAQRLDSFSSLEVVEGENGMVLHRGCAYIAPGGFHMEIVRASDGRYEISLTEDEPRSGHRPSVDTLFDSLIPFDKLERHIVLLTGMGSDGSKAMKHLYDSGVTDTYAESEETCVVYGMPRSAVELQCVSHILPLQEIPSKLAVMMK